MFYHTLKTLLSTWPVANASPCLTRSTSLQCSFPQPGHFVLLCDTPLPATREARASRRTHLLFLGAPVAYNRSNKPAPARVTKWPQPEHPPPAAPWGNRSTRCCPGRMPRPEAARDEPPPAVLGSPAAPGGPPGRELHHLRTRGHFVAGRGPDRAGAPPPQRGRAPPEPYHWKGGGR